MFKDEKVLRLFIREVQVDADGESLGGGGGHGRDCRRDGEREVGDGGGGGFVTLRLHLSILIPYLRLPHGLLIITSTCIVHCVY